MLPIRDLNPARRPAVVTGLIVAVAAAVFFLYQPHASDGQARFMYAEATIPCEIVTGQPLSANEIQTGTCESQPASPVFPRKRVYLTLLTSIFFHGGLGHLIGNLWVLWIFGNNVEDVMGRFRYLFFYLISGVAASAAHVFVNPGSAIPVVGASGAIAGVMGAYLAMFPGARVISIIPPLFFFPFQVPAVVFLGVWFLGQFALAGAQTNIAWEAHVGGFVLGALIGLFFRRHRRPYAIR